MTLKKPSVTLTKRTLEGVQQIGRELAEIRFFVKGLIKVHY